MADVKKTPNDFIFDRPIGEGSFSTVSINSITLYLCVFDLFFDSYVHL